jgi:uncharacterized protein YjbI with pentapeptide repeats
MLGLEPKQDFAGADLSGTDFFGGNLAGANFAEQIAGCQLCLCRFAEVNLTNADLVFYPPAIWRVLKNSIT